MQERGYAESSALKLVGDRYRLNARQRHALLRASCADSTAISRKYSERQAAQLVGQPVFIDGYNLLIGVESALSGGLLFLCRDGCYRDIASIHGTYKSVIETQPAIICIGQALQTLQTGPVCWYFDAPVSNSGRLRQKITEFIAPYAWQWQIELLNNPDKALAEAQGVVITSDGWILDRAPQGWFNMLKYLITQTQIGQPQVRSLV